MRTLLVAVAVLATAGCGSVPPELAAATEVQAAAVERVRDYRTRIILDYDRELRRAYRKHLNERLQVQIQQMQPSDPDNETIQSLVRQRDEQWERIERRMDGVRDRYLHDPNLDILEDLTGAVGRWVRAVDQTMRNIAALVGQGPAPVPQAVGIGRQP